MRLLKGRPSPATAISMLALFVALGGTGYAAMQLPKNSVGSKQIKKSAVKRSDIKKNAVNGSRVKNDSLTGSDILESALAKVPAAATADSAANATNATKAASADNATKAQSADTATTADTATNLAAAEDWHVIGTPGNPAFESGCVAYEQGSPNYLEAPAYYKDKAGVVHFRGIIECLTDSIAFTMPEGYRPADGKAIIDSIACFQGCDGTDTGGDDYTLTTGAVVAVGEGAIDPSVAGKIAVGGELMSLHGFSYRAEG